MDVDSRRFDARSPVAIPTSASAIAAAGSHDDQASPWLTRLSIEKSVSG
jgi:hypothetical protein